MTVVYPEGVPLEGNLKVAFVSAFADPDLPTVLEATAATGVDVSCYIKGGTFNLTGDQSTIEDRRLCSTVSYETPGRATRSIDDITYVYDPQAVAASGENEAYEKLQPGTKGFFIVRGGLPFDQDFATGDIVDIWPVQMGVKRKQTPSDKAEGEKFTVIQKPFVIGPVTDDVALVAGA